jgi:hypothetical protein
MIYDSIHEKDSPINYIVDKERNPEFTREVNKLLYILLDGLYLSISENIKLLEIIIKDYSYRLKEISNILKF